MNTTIRKSGQWYDRFRLNKTSPKILCLITAKMVSISKRRGIIESATITVQEPAKVIDGKLKKVVIANLIGKVKNYASLQNVKEI